MELNKIYQGDCLELMKNIPDGAVDFVLCDLPYGITNCSFDIKIDLQKFWTEIFRVTKFNAACAMFAKGKFLIELANSNFKYYRYKWVWHKNLATGFLNAKKMPLCAHEDILIFYRKLPTYNPQFTTGKKYRAKYTSNSKNYGKVLKEFNYHMTDGKYFPKDNLHYNFYNHNEHSQQKPTALLEYLIKTYSNEGEVVLDATIGSGSTAVAAINTGRNFIGFELDEHYFEVAQKRISEAFQKKSEGLF